MNKNFVASLSPLILCAACATVHSGRMALPVEAPLPLDISATTEGNAQKDGQAVLYVTFENLSPDWLDFERIEISARDGASSRIEIVQGRALADWNVAYAQKQALDDHNAAVVTGLVAGLGMAAVAASTQMQGSSAAVAGGVGAATLAGALTTGIARDLADLQKPTLLPPNYLVDPFILPGKLFVRKWALYRKIGTDAPQDLVLRLKVKDRPVATYALNLRSAPSAGYRR